MKQLTFYALLVLCLSAFQLEANPVKYLDYYEEARHLFVAAEVEQNIENLAKKSNRQYFELDFVDKKNGDFSIVYKAEEAKMATKIGFLTNLWKYYYKIDKGHSLKFWLKTSGQELSDSWKVTFIDANRKKATTTLKKTNTKGQWREMSISIKDIAETKDFNINEIKLVEFETGNFSNDATVKFDFVRYESASGEVIGITDKTIAQRVEEQKATKEIRIKEAFESSSKGTQWGVEAFAMLYLNKDVAKANEIIREYIKERGLINTWGLYETPFYIRLYCWFSSRMGKFPGRLEPETEKMLLEIIWKRTLVKNDIHWARQSTWYLDGSENHDLNGKACNLVSSYIFMNEPDYKDRIYPDYGFGGGYKYGGAGYYGKDVDKTGRHQGGRANLSDGKQYTAKDHYEAWLSFMKEYFVERSKYGFLLERHSSGYSKHSMNFIELAYGYSGDEELKKIIGDFMTLYWADWAQEGISGLTGGPKKRHTSVGGYDSNTGMLNIFLGVKASGDVWGYWNIVSDYEIPAIVQSMTLDREGMGTYIYRSRGIGEEVGEMPRPKGTERSLVCRQESRFLNYTYVTPYFTLGTQMEHPLAIHSHLSAGGWQGLVVGSDPDARICPVVFPLEENGKDRTKGKSYKVHGVYKNVQHENVLMFQKSLNYTVLDPDWFPLVPYRSETGVYFGNSWDEKVEKNHWIFVRRNNVYSAICVVEADMDYERSKITGPPGMYNFTGGDRLIKMVDKPYKWVEDEKLIELNNRYNPVILISGDDKMYGSFDKFIDQVSSTTPQLHKTVNLVGYLVTYTPPGDSKPEMYLNAGNIEIPTIDGEYINYEYPKTYESPYIKSEFGSGVIDINYDGQKMKLDFTK
jgi:hypothetical protein